MIRIFFFLFGFGLMTAGFTYLILYLNYMVIGYNFWEYVKFISRRFECYLPCLGLAIMLLSIFIKGERKHGLHL